jgi:hypothetical protein
MKIHLVLTDDWELRGDGSGNMRALQFDTLRRLLAIYERRGLVASINAEVMQQLHHRSLGERHADLRALADEWEELVSDACRRGHDVQLHVHPQWSDCSYEHGAWVLRGSWQLTDYAPEVIDTMVGDGKRYLEDLLRQVDPGYRCVAFRSGAWSIVPSTAILAALAKHGVAVDLSIADGLRIEGPVVWLDYRAVEEPFLPYYPDPDDARRVARSVQPVVCVPTHTFRAEASVLAGRSSGRPLPRLRYRVTRRVAQAHRRLGVPVPASIAEDYLRAGNSKPVADSGHGQDYAQRFWLAPPMPTVVSDISKLTFASEREAFRDIRLRAARTGAEVVPVVFTNHTKDIGDFAPLERFADFVSDLDDVDVISLRNLADNLAAGLYPIRLAGSEMVASQ